MFSNGKGRAPSGVRSGVRSGSGGLSFIGQDIVIAGNLTGTDQLHIDGRVDGNVTCATLILGENGTIAGNITADQATIAGLVDGTVNARMIELEATARVTGDVTYEVLSIAAGAYIEGRLSRRDRGSGDTVVSILPQDMPPPLGSAKKAS